MSGGPRPEMTMATGPYVLDDAAWKKYLDENDPVCKVPEEEFAENCSAKGNSVYGKTYRALVKEEIRREMWREMEEVKRSISRLSSENADLRRQLNDRRKNDAAQTVKSFSAIVTSNTPAAAEVKRQLLTVFNAETKQQKTRENSVVIIGLPEPETADQVPVQVNQFFNSFSLKVDTKSAVRHKTVTVVRLADKQQLRDVLNTLRFPAYKDTDHKKHFNNAWVREDLTPAQLAEVKRLNQLKNEKNKELTDAGHILDQPFRHIIHRGSGKILCCNSIKSRAQGRPVFEKPTAAPAQTGPAGVESN